MDCLWTAFGFTHPKHMFDKTKIDNNLFSFFFWGGGGGGWVIVTFFTDILTLIFSPNDF